MIGTHHVSPRAVHDIAERRGEPAVLVLASTVTTALTFAESEGGGTAAHWTGDLTEVTGLLRAVPKGLLQGSVHKVIEDVWAAVDKRLKDTPDVSG